MLVSTVYCPLLKSNFARFAIEDYHKCIKGGATYELNNYSPISKLSVLEKNTC